MCITNGEISMNTNKQPTKDEIIAAREMIRAWRLWIKECPESDDEWLALLIAPIISGNGTLKTMP